MRCQPITFPHAYRHLHWPVLPSISTCSLGPSDPFPHSLLFFFSQAQSLIALFLHFDSLQLPGLSLYHPPVFHLNHSEPHALSLARPFSSPVNTFLYFFSSNSSLMSHSGLVLFSFCLHFSSLLFISPCPSAYPPCAPYHPPHIRFSLTASIFSFPQELSPSLFTCSSSANEQCSALLFSPRNTHTHRNIY